MNGPICVGANPDGVMLRDYCTTRVLELKCPMKLSKLQTVHFERCVITPNLKKTCTYYCKLQLQMELTGVSSGDCFAFQGENTHLILNVPIYRDFLNVVVERAVLFL